MSTLHVPGLHDVPAPGIRHLVAVFLGLHGVAHLVGLQGALQAVEDGEPLPYLMGTWEVGSSSALYALAVAWGVGAVAMVVAAVWLWALRPGWWATLVAMAALSLALSVLALWMAWIGVVINVGLLVGAWLWHRSATAEGLHEV